ncbi:13 kDa ribonucleoprotein-associated protein [Penicillium malachiteum]|uniref:13 kDa ribonucleoprotein-associated protein n=1 Tax=Penicillium malachiteum TaxID=1324776 RepID=UPI002549AD2D|nr:13 kDa ribonucleoprotein-associated protein [Penicillium malachiteum]KAJ5735412.1 13 kDa ribonucleoprotein-associated protein [Penicillium malachiteum]
MASLGEPMDLDVESPKEDEAWPIANESLTQELLELLRHAAYTRQVKKGSNEVLKNINRNKAKLVILAADTQPLMIVAHLTSYCEEKDIPYVYVPSRNAIGRVCRVTCPISAACIISDEDSELTGRLQRVKVQVESLFI